VVGLSGFLNFAFDSRDLLTLGLVGLPVAAVGSSTAATWRRSPGAGRGAAPRVRARKWPSVRQRRARGNPDSAPHTEEARMSQDRPGRHQPLPRGCAPWRDPSFSWLFWLLRLLWFRSHCGRDGPMWHDQRDPDDSSDGGSSDGGGGEGGGLLNKRCPHPGHRRRVRLSPMNVAGLSTPVTRCHASERWFLR